MLTDHSLAIAPGDARLELLYHISREIAGRLDLADVLSRIVSLTAESVGAISASLIVFDARGKVSHGWLLYDGRLIGDASAQLAQYAERGLAGWVARHRQAVLIPNVDEDSRWHKLPASAGEGTKSVVAVPLTLHEHMVGALTLVHSRLGYFGADDLALLTSIAEQAAVAVDNARLYEDSRKQAAVMSALVETARAVASTLDLNEVLHLLLARIVSLLEVEAASIALMTGDMLEFKVAEGGGSDDIVGRRIAVGQGIAGTVIQSGQPVLVPDTASDQRFFAGMDRQIGFLTRSIICVPITVKERHIGVIEVMNPRRGFFGEDDLELVMAIAGMAGNAIAHAQLFLETQAAEARYLALFEDSIDPILITDLTGRITDANRKATEFLGYSREELKGLVIGSVHRMGTGPIGAQRFSHITGGREVSFETRMTNKHGEAVPVEVHAKRIVRDGQEFIQWIQRDLSERLALEETRSDLISMIVHDLRSPLGNIISSLDVLQATLPRDDEVVGPVLAIAFRSSQRLSRLIDSLLDLRRLEAGQAVLHKEPASLNALVAEAADQVHALAEGKAILLRLEVPPRLPQAQIDADMIRRVLINLLENAVKYSETGGTIVVSSRADDHQVTIGVKDTGPGIPAGEQARIFQKFARLHGHSGPKGLGLGLAFCKLAVEAHGGKIWVESEVGRGSAFQFTLPVQGAPAQPGQARP
jgi:PAS domain S-box-containing protein